MLSDADLQLLKYLWNRGTSGWSQAACYDRAFPHNRHVSPQAKSQYIARLKGLPEWQREWDALDAAAREEVEQSVRDFTRTLAERSREPYERFADFEQIQIFLFDPLKIAYQHLVKLENKTFVQLISHI